MDINWVAVAAISDVLGVIAVVISIIYLAVQIRKQTDEARLTATRELAQQLNDIISLLATDPEILALYRKGLKDLHALPDEQRFRVSIQMNRLIRCIEQHYLHMASRNVEPDYENSMNQRAMEVMSLRGYQQWWALNRSAYSPGFVDYIDERIALADKIGYVSSYQKNLAATEEGGAAEA